MHMICILYCKYIDNHDTNIALSSVLKDILNWDENSGTKIYLNKTCKFHICKKRNCDAFRYKFKINNTLINNVTQLKFGVLYSILNFYGMIIVYI